MTSNIPHRQQLRDLLASASDGELSPEEQSQLNALLAEHQDLVREYMSLISVDHLLRQEPVQRYLAVLVDENKRTSDVHTEQPNTSARTHTYSVRFPKNWTNVWALLAPKSLAWSGALAALLLVGFTVWTLLLPASATIVETHDALWADARQRDLGDALGSKWLTLESGSTKIAFRQGAVMTVEGPATFRVLSAGSCSLKEGSLSAYVPEEAVGFSVTLSNAIVVDLGTAFRIDEKTDGKSRVYVTEGIVRIDPQLAGEVAGESVTLHAGQIAEWSDSDSPQVRPSEKLAPKTSGKMVFDTFQPASLGIGQYKHDDKIFVYLERPETVLQHELRVDVLRPGPHNDFTTSEGIIPAGTRVRSYLIHFSPEKKRQVLSGSATFTEPILGVLCDSDRLNATNATLGSTVLDLRCLHPERGLESRPNVNSDVVTISADRKKLSVKFSTESIDHLRVITAIEP